MSPAHSERGEREGRRESVCHLYACKCACVVMYVSKHVLCVCVWLHVICSQLIRFSGVELGEACTVVIRGATQQILDEAQRSLHDALCVLIQTVKESRIVYGGGNVPCCYKQ